MKGEGLTQAPLEIQMSSALTPREIQTRIRSGESLEDVAKAAGVPVEKIEPFAAPVIAEREHVASTALTSPVRRTGDSGNHRTLRQVVQERLLSRGLDIDDVEWDAWRIADRTWAVQGTYQSGSATRVAEFRYEQLGRFSVASNDDARWLLGESSSAHGPQPNRRRRGEDPDAEPTVDFTDEFALANAVGVAVEESPEQLAGPFDLLEDDPQLTQVDGVYDIVPHGSQLDALYDMFRSMNEDSVEIYPGLGETRSVAPHVPLPPEDEPLEGTILQADPETQAQADAYEPEPAIEPHVNPVTLRDATPTRSRRQRHAERTQPVELQQPSLVEASEAEPEPALQVPQDVPGEVVVEMESEPQQAPTSGATPAESSSAPEPTPAKETAAEDTVSVTRARSRKKRASVPSWDEIMFGSPKQPPLG